MKCVKKIVRHYWKYQRPASGYRELVSATQSVGGLGANIGFQPGDSTVVKFKYIYSSGAGYLIGITSANDSTCFRFWKASGDTILDYGSGSGYNRIRGSYITSTTDIYETEFGNRYVKDLITDTVKFSASSKSFGRKSDPMYIFANSSAYGTIFYCKIYDSNQLERDLVPCIRESDNVVGMYDKVYNVFYAPTTTWTAGETIILEGTEDDYDYYTDDEVALLPKETVRHYWKYQYTTWTQPVLTGDSSYGDVYCDTLNSGYNPYKMFDGNLQDNASRFESNTQPDLVEWFLPYNEYIKVTAIDFYNKYTGENYGTKTLKLYAGENRTKPLTDVVTVTVGTRALTHIDIPVENQTFSNIFAIDFISKQGNNLGAQEVYITAQKRTVVAGTESDYDFYTDDQVYYGIKQ